MSRSELGRTAVIGILAGYIVSGSAGLLGEAFGTVGLLLGYVIGVFLAGMGLVSAIVWLYRITRRQS